MLFMDWRDSNPETTQDSEANSFGVKAAVSLLRFYKREISPILPKSCRYIPTCSEYSMEAYKKYGVVKVGLDMILQDGLTKLSHSKMLMIDLKLVTCS